MSKITKEIKDYWKKQSPYLSFDVDILDRVINTLSDEERKILTNGDSDVKEEHDRYLFAVTRAFNRHNDFVCGYSDVADNGDIICSEKSSISELDIDYKTLVTCNRSAIYKVADMQTELLPSMTFEASVELTAAVLKYHAQHNIDMEN